MPGQAESSCLPYLKYNGDAQHFRQAADVFGVLYDNAAVVAKCAYIGDGSSWAFAGGCGQQNRWSVPFRSVHEMVRAQRGVPLDAYIDIAYYKRLSGQCHHCAYLTGSGYNEVVADGRNITRRLPSAVAAFFYFKGSRAIRENARALQQRFFTQYPSARTGALVAFDPCNWTAPFSGDSFGFG